MPIVKKVLLPVDLADDVAKLLDFGHDLARQLQAKLHVLYVVREFDFARGLFIPHENIDRMEEEFRQGAQRHMEKVREEHFGDDPGVTTAVAFGAPDEEILSYAKANGIDLIVVCTHGRKGLEHAIFGSVAEKVVKKSPVCVLTVRPDKL
jgi:nucleotide-binding universal stress UspA family protein